MNSHLDSAIVNFQKLVRLYPNSQYTLLVRSKLSEVDAHRHALEQSEKDSTTQNDSLSATPVGKEIPGMQEKPVREEGQSEVKSLGGQSVSGTPEENPERKPRPR